MVSQKNHLLSIHCSKDEKPTRATPRIKFLGTRRIEPWTIGYEALAQSLCNEDPLQEPILLTKLLSICISINFQSCNTNMK